MKKLSYYEEKKEKKTDENVWSYEKKIVILQSV